MRWFLVALPLALAQAGPSTSPGTAPRFDVVSIKPNTSADAMPRIAIEPGGKYRWTNASVRQLIGMSYQRRAWDNREVIGGPDWIESARFDIEAHTDATLPLVDPDGFPGPLFAMVRTLLEDRFQLRVHDEQRERPVYMLTLARRDGKLGPKMKRVDVDCAALMKDQTQGKRPELKPGQLLPCAVRAIPGHVDAVAIDMQGFAGLLGSLVGRLVIDRTNLTGTFDATFDFTPELTQGPGGRADAPPAVGTDAPSVFTAIQEQLGLKLESTRAPVDVLVIDRVERPTEN